MFKTKILTIRTYYPILSTYISLAVWRLRKQQNSKKRKRKFSTAVLIIFESVVFFSILNAYLYRLFLFYYSSHKKYVGTYTLCGDWGLRTSLCATWLPAYIRLIQHNIEYTLGIRLLSKHLDENRWIYFIHKRVPGIHNTHHDRHHAN